MFNVVQEHVIRGGVPCVSEGRTRWTGAVGAAADNVRLNGKLWALADVWGRGAGKVILPAALQPSNTASVISSPRSMIAKASRICGSVMVSGGIAEKLDQRMKVNKPSCLKNAASLPMAGCAPL